MMWPFCTPMICRQWLALLLSLSVILIDNHSAIADEYEHLRSICANKRVDLSRASEISKLTETSKSQDGDDVCSKRIRLALVELDQLLSLDNENVCSPLKVKQIKDYYVKYIDQKSSVADEQLPKSLGQFFLAYGLGVSNICKKNMITSLMLDAHELLNEHDYELISPWTSEQSVIGKIMNEPSDYDDLILPKDIAGLFGQKKKKKESDNEDLSKDDKIFLQTATGDVVRKIQTLCERRFRPIYEQLILPLITLSNIGFNYQGEELERELKEMSTNKEVHQWYRIVYLCESVSNIEIVEDQRDASKSQGLDRRLVRILSKDEAEELKKEKEDKIEAPATTISMEDYPDIGEKINYQMDFGLKMGDLIVDVEDRNLHRLVNKFETHKSELDRIRAKVIKKLASHMKEFIMSGKVNIVAGLMRKGAHNGNMNDDMVRTIDEFVGQMSANGGQDGAVSGLKDFTKRIYHNTAYQGVSGLGIRAKSSVEGAGFKATFWRVVATILFVLGLALMISAVGR